MLYEWPCGTCKKAVKWNPKRPSICGDNCETWFHIDCQHVHSGVSRYMDASNMSWDPVVWVNLHVCKCESRSAVLLV
jgi:hypothetical protein